MTSFLKFGSWLQNVADNRAAVVSISLIHLLSLCRHYWCWCQHSMLAGPCVYAQVWWHSVAWWKVQAHKQCGQNTSSGDWSRDQGEPHAPSGVHMNAAIVNLQWMYADDHDCVLLPYAAQGRMPRMPCTSKGKWTRYKTIHAGGTCACTCAVILCLGPETITWYPMQMDVFLLVVCGLCIMYFVTVYQPSTSWSLPVCLLNTNSVLDHINIQC